MKTLAALIFPGFQTLDLFGPLEMLGDSSVDIEVTIVAETLEPVPSAHGQSLLVDKKLTDGIDYDSSYRSLQIAQESVKITLVRILQTPAPVSSTALLAAAEEKSCGLNASAEFAGRRPVRSMCRRARTPRRR